MTWMAKGRALVIACWAVIAASVAHAATSGIVSEERNYRAIIDRNPFGLKPPPPPPTNAPAVTQPKDEILLTGITSIGALRAYFMTKAPQGKNPEFYSLGVDEKKNELEVISIDTTAGSVRVRNAGIETVMTFAANGVKPPATPTAAPGAPGTAIAGAAVVPTAGQPGGAFVTPPGLPASSVAGASARARTIPSRGRTPNMDPNMAARYGLTPGGMQPGQAPPRADPNAAIQDVMIMELQKRANPNMPFPPTPMPTQ